ncbi:MAG: MBL fold metallo-hydrolase [Caulobacterales bacterium]|nr:MBL fold metallo-hydrolase [Caulobacterales bacterium]
MSEGGDRLRVTILGCGSSAGVPRVDGDWGECDPANPKNRRTRSSILVERAPAIAEWDPARTTRVLVDTSPDLRAQLLASATTRVDGVLFTHHHADQSHGIDDLRPIALAAGRRIPVHMDPFTADILGRRFEYLFFAQEGSLYHPIMELHADLEPGARVRIDGPGGPVEALALAQRHGPIASLGFRFGPAAYSNDVSDMPPETFAALSGLQAWIVDALRRTPHPSHAHLSKALEWIDAVRPQHAYLTDMHVALDYDAVAAETPAHVSPAYDGLRLEFALA